MNWFFWRKKETRPVEPQKFNVGKTKIVLTYLNEKDETKLILNYVCGEVCWSYDTSCNMSPKVYSTESIFFNWLRTSKKNGGYSMEAPETYPDGEPSRIYIPLHRVIKITYEHYDHFQTLEDK